jgi:predicted dehydrogenase
VTLRIGLVGAGGNTRARHIPGFLALDDVEIVAVANRSRASGESIAADYGIAKVYDDWEALVAADDIDAICIGTWPNMHAPVTLSALAAGKHVLTEARMAMDLAEARRMHEASVSSDLVTMVVPAPLYLAYEPRLLEMLAAGDFGDVLEVSVSAMSGSYDPGGPLGWRQRRDLSGHNTMSVGIFNEVVRRYIGPERSVMAHG